MGANLIADGATFRAWAPNAHSVHVIGEFNGRQRNDASLLTKDDNGHWKGFIRGVRDRHRYLFYVVGDGGEGPKRDPYARELETPFPSDCIVRKTDFPWHETGFVTPQFQDFVIYQLHTGVYFTPNLPRKAGTFLDVARKDSPSVGTRRDRGPTDADPGIPIVIQPGLQRYRLLLPGDGFRGRGGRSGPLCRGAPMPCWTPRD